MFDKDREEFNKELEFLFDKYHHALYLIGDIWEMKYLIKKRVSDYVDDKTKVDMGGYVEAMNSDMLDEAIDKLVETFKQWEDAPLTEPEMVEYAKKDLLKYIEYKLDKI